MSTRSTGAFCYMLAAYVEVWLVILAGREFQRPMSRRFSGRLCCNPGVPGTHGTHGTVLEPHKLRAYTPAKVVL